MRIDNSHSNHVCQVRECQFRQRAENCAASKQNISYDFHDAVRNFEGVFLYHRFLKVTNYGIVCMLLSNLGSILGAVTFVYLYASV